MAVVTVRFADRPELWERIPELFAGLIPEFNIHGDVGRVYWRRWFKEFPQFQLALHDDELDDVLAVARALPGRWDGTPQGLNSGLDACIEAAFTEPDPNVLYALGIEVAPRHQGKGLSKLLLRELTALAAAHGFSRVAVPIRPTWKDRYPLTPIGHYAAWTGKDGSPFDPWLRTHVNLGGVITGSSERSSLITGRVEEWESWTGMAFPEDGTYVFPGGLSPLRVDRTTDLTTYWEPAIWVVHQADG
ncbi:GNAT superfamily N-acetyltransferase [Kitasatospora sp. GP30]|uniref:GNAT family N-acetyltransferase n=1 Tax=Kitasatospora sp. GP30 TaxID=3035084 RepID=UPI000C714F9F|nr:GNAT family N-acetyltransferase [Kitasatospora sp. GP30]MDH6139953.1 GNAT superfamily N-acetyltransferase [Kitasatospora sp. GP30]